MLAKTEGACKNVQYRDRDNIGRIIEANKQNKQNKTKYKKAKQSKANQNKKKKKTTEKISYTDQSDKNYLYCCLYMDCRWLSNYHEGSGLSSLIIMREWVVITNYHEGSGLSSLIIMREWVVITNYHEGVGCHH